jgi:hypothetical protein
VFQSGAAIKGEEIRAQVLRQRGELCAASQNEDGDTETNREVFEVFGTAEIQLVTHMQAIWQLGEGRFFPDQCVAVNLLRQLRRIIQSGEIEDGGLQPCRRFS